MSVLLRVVLDDEPGSLGAVGTAIGRLNAGIGAVRVVDRRDGRVIDDFEVELPPGSSTADLVNAVRPLAGVEVEVVRPAFGSALPDDLEQTDMVGNAEAALLLPLLAVQLIGADWAAIVQPAGNGVATSHATRGAPRLWWGSLPWLPLPTARSVAVDGPWVPDLWRDLGVCLAAAPVGDSGVVVLLGRAGGPRFRPTEIARLGQLASLTAALERQLGQRVLPVSLPRGAGPLVDSPVRGYRAQRESS